MPAVLSGSDRGDPWSTTLSGMRGMTVLKSERLGHEEPGMRGVYGHVSQSMREELKAAQEARWQKSLHQRRTDNTTLSGPTAGQAAYRGVRPAVGGCPLPFGSQNRTSAEAQRKPQIIGYRVTCGFGVGVAGFEPAASSSRSQVQMSAASAAACLACGRPSVDVRWRPPLSVAIVTHFVTRPLASR
jgi:hypothetical protein